MKKFVLIAVLVGLWAHTVRDLATEIAFLAQQTHHFSDGMQEIYGQTEN
jgi:hypothetical protein